MFIKSVFVFSIIFPYLAQKTYRGVSREIGELRANPWNLSDNVRTPPFSGDQDNACAGNKLVPTIWAEEFLSPKFS